MKRLLCLLLIFCFLPLVGCQEETVTLQDPVTVYYRRTELQFGSVDGVIAPVQIEGAAYKDDLLSLLNLYLKGPTVVDYENTFPFRTEVLELELSDTKATLLMSSSLSNLTGIDLTIACACLTKTVMELTGVRIVTIRVQVGTLDGSETITMDQSTLHLLDHYQPETTNPR